jgi:hypothetical protein
MSPLDSSSKVSWTSCDRYTNLMFVTLTDCVSNKINGEWKSYFDFGSNCESTEFWSWEKNKHIFESLFISVILYGREVWGFSNSRDSWIDIKIIENFGTLILAFRIFLLTSSSQVDNLYLLLLQPHFVSYSREHE